MLLGKNCQNFLKDSIYLEIVILQNPDTKILSAFDR